MFRIRIRHEGTWVTIDKFHDEDKWNALAAYNNAPVPKMLISSKGIVHKQYSDNGFIYLPKDANAAQTA